MRYTAISADGHVNEPPDLWTSRLPGKFKDRGPRVIETPNSHGHAWIMEGQQRPSPMGLNAVYYRSSKRFDRASIVESYNQRKDRGVRYEDLLPGSFDPRARVSEMLEDHIDAEVIFNGPQTVWLGIKLCPDPALTLACYKAYNDWIAEFQAYDPQRLICNGTLPTTGLDDCVAELYRCAEMGLRAVQLESYPSGGFAELSPEDDRFWAAAVELDMAVNIHTMFFFPVGDLGGKSFSADSLRAKSRGLDLNAGRFQTILANMITQGVFERFPRLRFVGTEVWIGWMPYYLARFDESVRQRRHAWKQPLLPSEYFRRNVSLVYVVDEAGVADVNRYDVGIGNILWGPDYPHSASNWPVDYELGREILERAGCSRSEIERIMWRNAADLYRLPYEDPLALVA
jgi:predicted TIM-barrel fold metal-dependent hydrolase